MPNIVQGTNVATSLEALVDANGLANVLEALAELCDAKAEHVEANWQDVGLARLWRSAYRVTQGSAARVHRLSPVIFGF